MSKKSIRLMAVVCLLGWATLDADFVEDFESYEVHAFLDSLPNWTTVVFGNANTEVTGGDYFIESVNGSNRLHSPRGGATIAVVNADVLTLVAGADFELSVDMMWIGNGIGNGLIFNYQDQGNFYYLEIISPQRGDTGFNLKKRAGGSSQTLVGIAPADLALNTEYRLHVQYKAGPNTFEVSLETLDDGIVVQAFGDIVDDSFRGGQIGVWSNSSFTGQFDNLTLVKASGIAEAPNPAIDAPDVARDAVLTWKPGQFASTHDVYFGTQLDDVNDASRANPLNVLVSQGQSDTTFDPAGVLEFGQTYFWRVDEVNSAPDFTVFKGGIWSFTAEPLSIPITQLTVTASSSFGASVPENTINGSGLTGDLHGTVAPDMWISTGIPATIEYAFDRAYKLHEMWVWNSNQTIEAFIGFGAKDVVIEHSLDGENWTVLEGVGPLAQAPGTAGYAHNNTIGFGGVTAQHVRMTINSVQGFAPQASLSEVRFFSIPTSATRPDPATGAADVAPGVTLSWGRDGREAERHEIYLGTDADNLPLVGSVTESSFDTLALDLQLGQTYSWRIDEVNEAADPSTWAGDIWSFTTVERIVIDDMEAYADREFAEIWATWIDGFEDPTNNGALVGANPALGDFSPEKGIVHGGGQSLPLHYDNSAAAQSEATRTFDTPMDWTRHGVQALVLYFQGSPSNTGGNLYVNINDTKITYPSDPENLQRLGWSKWVIPLAEVSGTDLSQVRSLTIGVDSGGTGVVYIDDIVLTDEARVLTTPVTPAADNLISHWAFEGDAADGTGTNSGTLMGNIPFVAGKVGQAIELDGAGDFVALTGYKGLLGAPAITVTAWVNLPLDSSGGAILGWGPAGTGTRFGFRVSAGRLRIEHHAGNLQGDTGLVTGAWHHVAVVIQANSTISHPEVALYLDGIDDTRPGQSANPFALTAGEDARIGSRPSNDDRFFAGSIDELYLYDRALSPEEIAGAAGRTEPFDQ